MDDIRKKLITVNLRYGEVSAPLRARAFGQLIEKTLFLNKEGLNFDRIRVSLAAMVGVHSVAQRTTKEAIRFLSKDSRTIEKTKQGKWSLREKRYKEIGQEIERAEKRRSRLLQRHFPSSIQEKQLRSWFEDACVAFFIEYGNLIVSLLSCEQATMSKKYSFVLNEILQNVVEQHQLKNYERQLLEGFKGFIRSSDRQDQEDFMNIVQAMIASRFVASDIGGDPLALEGFRKAIILLDTNVLFAASLEKHKITKSLEALGKALKVIGVELKFVYPTKKEYENTVAYQRDRIITVVENFSRSVLEETNDLFVQTALARGCIAQEDFERFFKEINLPPKELSTNTPITLVDNRDVETAAKDGMKDEKLKAKIRTATSPARRNKPKGRNTVNHDAALVYIVERARENGQNVWVLTLDTGMQGLSAERAGEHGFPLWISVEALLQILSVDSQGTDIDPTDFAPLLGRILTTEYIPSPETYTIEDLYLLAERESRITSLPDEKIKEVASKVRRAILQGKRRNDPELTLLIQREFQGFRLGHEEELRKAKEEVEKERKSREFVEQKLTRMQGKALSDRIKSIRFDVFLSLGKILLLALVIGGLVFLASDKLFNLPSSALSIFISLLASIITLLAGKVWRAVIRLLKAPEEARQEFERGRK